MTKYVDNAAIIQVIGTVFNNSSLLDETDKYIIHEDDFTTNLHKVIFGSMYQLHKMGSKVTLDAIIDFLSNRPKYNSIFQTEKGIEYIQRASELSSLETFNYYYNRLKKFTLLRAYEKIGFDVSFLYDAYNVLDVKKKQEQEDWLDNHSINDIAIAIDEEIERVKSKYVEEEITKGFQASEGMEELIAELQENPEVGIPLYGNLINVVTRGARLKKFYLRSAPTGYGKAIPNDTIIPTPMGNKTVGEIKVGDYLFGQNGKPVKVLQIHPQPTKKDVWKVTFIDGREALCCEDHLWEYRYKSYKGYDYRVEPLKKIVERANKLKNGLRQSNGRGFRFAIKLNKAVEYSEKKYSVDPYIMGALIGDGDFTNKFLSFSNPDEKLPNLLAELLGDKIKAIKDNNKNYSYYFQSKNILRTKKVLKDFPKLWNCETKDLFIPEEYLQGSIEQRYSLLQGLMDADGTISVDTGRTVYTTVSHKLRDNIITLCRSLGFITSFWTEKCVTGECYRICIQCSKKDKTKFFKLSRNLEKAVKYANNGKRSEYKDCLSIVNIEKLDYKTDMTCFTVDSSDHLFLMNDYIVTHNTRTMIADACNFACDEIYDETLEKWISNNTAEPTLFITTEQEKSEIQTMMLAFLAAVEEEHILNGKYEEGELERVKYAIKVFKRSPIWVEELPDFSVQDVENKIKKHIREHNIKYLCHDYIHTSMKILEEISSRSGGVKLREDNILFILSTKLKDLCNEYGIFIMSATQLSGDWQNSDTPDQNLLRGAKAIADKCDAGMVILPVSNEDLEKLSPILNTNRYKTPNMKISVYKNRRGKFKGIYMWCYAQLGKCRVEPMFITDFGHGLLNVQDIKIMVDKEDEEEVAF